MKKEQKKEKALETSTKSTSKQVDYKTIEENIQVPQEKMLPYKLAILMELATKNIKTIVNYPKALVSYDDIEFILTITLEAVRKAKEV